MSFKKKTINRMWDDRFLSDIAEIGEKRYEKQIRNAPIYEDYLKFKKRNKRN